MWDKVQIKEASKWVKFIIKILHCNVHMAPLCLNQFISNVNCNCMQAVKAAIS